MSQRIFVFMILTGLLFMILKRYFKTYSQASGSGGWFSDPAGQGGGGGSSGAG